MHKATAGIQEQCTIHSCGTPSRGGQILCLSSFRRLSRRYEIAHCGWQMATASFAKKIAHEARCPSHLPFVSLHSVLSATLAPKTGRGQRRRMQEIRRLAKWLDARLASATKRALSNPGGCSGSKWRGRSAPLSILFHATHPSRYTLHPKTTLVRHRHCISTGTRVRDWFCG